MDYDLVIDMVHVATGFGLGVLARMIYEAIAGGFLARSQTNRADK